MDTTNMEAKRIPIVLTIAGSDSGGGAGIQADVKTLTSLNVYSATAITALTAQNTTGVQAIHVPPPTFLETQLESVFTDMRISAVKTGMLPNKQAITSTATYLRRYNVTNVVVDPVLVATSGDRLVHGDDVVDTLVSQLFPLATVVTPNVPEAEVLTGLQIETEDDVRTACRKLVDMGCRNALVKGGHAYTAATSNVTPAQAVDVLYNGRDFNAFCTPWVNTRNTHGTGCTLASAIAAGLARGESVDDAIGTAKQYVFRGISEALDIGQGCGPLYHMHTVMSFHERG